MQTVSAKGVDVPVLGFGTWQLDGEACAEGVRHALELGYRHLDTAQMYDNEVEVGRGLAASGVARDEVFLTTKLAPGSLDPGRVGPATEASLRRLGTDRVDLLLVHWPDRHVPVGATLEAMRRLQDDGKVAHLGVSNFPPALLQSAADEAALLTNQVEYHPLLGQDALLAVCREQDVILTAYSPLAKGSVLGEVELKEIAEAHERTVAQVALRWLIQQDGVAAIPKSADPGRRAENFQVLDFALSSEEMARISALDRRERLIDPPFAPEW